MRSLSLFIPASLSSCRSDFAPPKRDIPQTIRRYNVNRYERFRTKLLEELGTQPSPTVTDIPRYIQDQSINETNLIDVGKRVMEVLSSNRRSFNRTWKRISPLMELIVHTSINKEDNVDARDEKRLQYTEGISSTVADIGCDHGILSLSLACISWVVMQRRTEDKVNLCDGRSFNFSTQVIGSDESSQALQNGGLVSLQKMMDAMKPIKCDSELPIEFRLGSGLDCLKPGEADAVVLAGMGVHSILDILYGKDGSITAPVDRVKTQTLFLQPTNSRPQHMIILYDQLQKDDRWVLRDERIAFVGGRWYISAFFERGRNDNIRLESENSYHFPGQYLLHSGDAYDAYVHHHLKWLKDDYDRPKGDLEGEDKRWIEYIFSTDERRKHLASWFQ